MLPYCVLFDPLPCLTPKEKQKPYRMGQFRLTRGGVGPGKSAKDAKPTKPGAVNRLPINVKMF